MAVGLQWNVRELRQVREEATVANASCAGPSHLRFKAAQAQSGWLFLFLAANIIPFVRLGLHIFEIVSQNALYIDVATTREIHGLKMVESAFTIVRTSPSRLLGRLVRLLFRRTLRLEFPVAQLLTKRLNAAR